MKRAEKILEKMKNNPRDWRIEDLKTLARAFGIGWEQPGTSHVTFRKERAGHVSVPAHKPIKPIYIKKFIQLIEKDRA